MAKRVGVILAGCGHRDGSDVGEATIALVALDRMGADVVCAAPDQPQSVVVNHLTSRGVETAPPSEPGVPSLRGVAPAKPPKRALLAEAARLTRGRIVSLAALGDRDLDALIIPGGQGVGYNLSSYADKGELCEVHPDVARLLRAMLSAHKPIGVSSLAAILAARVLGPVAGVRLTLGSKHPPAAKHAAVMGADVRPCNVDDVVTDQKARVISTPASMYDDAPLRQIAIGMEKLVRTVVGLARDRSPRPVPPTAVPGSPPSI